MKKYIINVFIINALSIALILIIQHWIRPEYSFGKIVRFVLGVLPNIIVSASLPFLFHSIDLLRKVDSKKFSYSLSTLLIQIANEVYRTFDQIPFDTYDMLFSIITLCIFYPLVIKFKRKFDIYRQLQYKTHQ